MINEIRNTVLYFLSKDGRGYLTPLEFNSFAEMAQRSIFESDFSAYNRLIIQQSNRLTNGEFADLPKNLRERIDRFSQYAPLSKSGDTWTYAVTDVHRVEGLTYNTTDIEEVSKLDINKLNNTPLVSNSTTYPVYTRVGKNFRVFPSSITTGVEMYYLRTPISPKWTYNTVGGNPLFNPSLSDYKDFDMHESCFEVLVSKILSYAGISINSQEITNYVDTQTQLEMAKQR
jgi:hypothetical protein